MKSLKKWALASASMLTAGMLAACGNQGADSDSGTATGTDQLTLQMYQIGDKPENYDTLISEANKIIEEEIDATLNINYIGMGRLR